jgi:hypothetical protein
VQFVAAAEALDHGRKIVNARDTWTGGTPLRR